MSHPNETHAAALLRIFSSLHPIGGDEIPDAEVHLLTLTSREGALVQFHFNDSGTLISVEVVPPDNEDWVADAATRTLAHVGAWKGLAAWPSSPSLGAAHALGMLIAVKHGEISGRKAHRWLGWAQAACVNAGVGLLEDMKAINKAASDAPQEDKLQQGIEGIAAANQEAADLAAASADYGCLPSPGSEWMWEGCAGRWRVLEVGEDAACVMRIKLCDRAGTTLITDREFFSKHFARVGYIPS